MALLSRIIGQLAATAQQRVVAVVAAAVECSVLVVTVVAGVGVEVVGSEASQRQLLEMVQQGHLQVEPRAEVAPLTEEVALLQ
ncbi:MAG: hypothetical protein K8T25_07950 [Planctomycetia bacterium]|nr:hypothetical protein [Planctomycetia bacterium]